MKHQLTIQKLLQTRMTDAKAKNPSFSLRALSRKAGLSPAMTSRVLSGQRQVSIRLAKKIVVALMLDPQEQSEILSLFPDPKKLRQAATNPVADEKTDSQYLQLTADHFRAISEWHYFAILSLFKTKGFRSDAEWIAQRLGLSAPVVTQALDRLKRLGIVTQDKKGKLARSPAPLRTTDDVMNLSVRKAHFESLELARKSLEIDSIDKRDFTSLTLAFPAERLNEAKVMIRKFEDEFDGTFEGGASLPTEVYRLCVSLFPLTKSQSGKKDI